MRMTHALRGLHDGILVGVGTVAADNPSLNTRLVPGTPTYVASGSLRCCRHRSEREACACCCGGLPGPNPTPIIVDSSLRCPTSIKLFTSPACVKPVIVFVGMPGDAGTLVCSLSQRQRSNTD